MATFLLIIHITVCFFLIFIVLIQSGKGAELGAAFGGSSQTLFGARGAATFFSKMTTIAAVVFMITSLSLAVVSSKRASVVKGGIPAATEQKTLPPGQASGPIQGAQPQQPVEQAPPVPSAPPDVPSK
jgi:preprotein translocase subunit SecG